MMTNWSSKIHVGHDWEVLADGLEQYRHPRLAKELREAVEQRKRMTFDQMVDDSFWTAAPQKRWRVIHGHLVKAIRQIQSDKSQKQYDYKANHLGYREYMVSATEAGNLLREAGRTLADLRAPRTGRYAQDFYVELPFGEKGWLGRRSREKYASAFMKYNVTPPKRNWFYVVTLNT